MKKIIFYVMLFSAVSCRQAEKFVVIDLQTGSQTQAQISEIAVNVTAIPLETTPECVLDGRYSLTKDDTLLFILSRQEIYLFGKSGKFHKRLTTRGRGPGEISVLGFELDKEKKEVFAYSGSGSQICRYTYNGDLISQTVFQYPHGNIGYFKICDNMIYTTGANYDGERHSLWLLKLNKNLEKQDSSFLYYPQLPSFARMFSTSIGLSAVDNELFMHFPNLRDDRILRDTLFRLDKNQPVPYLKLNYGTHTFTEPDPMGYGGHSIFLYPMYRNKRFLFASYSLFRPENKRENFVFCYDFNTKKQYNLKDGFDDNIYHSGKTGILHPVDISNNEFYFEKYYDELTQSFPKRTEIDNPVLFIVSLKQ